MKKLLVLTLCLLSCGASYGMSLEDARKSFLVESFTHAETDAQIAHLQKIHNESPDLFNDISNSHYLSTILTELMKGHSDVEVVEEFLSYNPAMYKNSWQNIYDFSTINSNNYEITEEKLDALKTHILSIAPDINLYSPDEQNSILPTILNKKTAGVVAIITLLTAIVYQYTKDSKKA